MELAAVVVVPAEENAAAFHQTHTPRSVPASSRHRYCSRMPILGNDILQAWMECIRKLGMQSLWLTSSVHDENITPSALSSLAGQGIERLLMIKLKSYAEIDLADLLRFHCESQNSITEAHDGQGQLGIYLLDRLALLASHGKSESSSDPQVSGRILYAFRGYAKRILAGKERQELIGDALTGACAMRPVGTQIREQVWIGEGAVLAGSVRLIGPAYVGARTTVRDGATIGPFASVEQDCIVDCGTTIERATVLPHTYVAPGLRVHHALVDGTYLEDLSCGIIADLQPAGLAGRLRRNAKREIFSEHRDLFSQTSPTQPSRTPLWSAAVSAGPQSWCEVQL